MALFCSNCGEEIKEQKTVFVGVADEIAGQVFDSLTCVWDALNREITPMDYEEVETVTLTDKEA